MGDALSHSVVPGVAVAYYIGWPFAQARFVTGLLGRGGHGLSSNETRLREDAVIGVVFTAFFALGLLLISLYPEPGRSPIDCLRKHPRHFESDIVQVLIISGVTLVVLG
jgi:ABC-type Mn2+/Zn2+ transport system permease subunit